MQFPSYALFIMGARIPTPPYYHTKTRQPLNTSDVSQIFAMKEREKTDKRSAHNYATCIALQFGVSEKTIRDIWNGRTWCEETGMPKDKTTLGRPIGAKDKKQRKLKPPSAPIRRKPAVPLEIFRLSSIEDQMHDWTRSFFVPPHLFDDDSIAGLE
jgi:hypothetical protein